jgi:PTS system nitrogen regulatory IIA component
MDLKVRDVARLLNVSEDTIYRWARLGSLPAHRLDNQYRFNRVELQEWAAVHNHRVSRELFAPHGSAEESETLSSALERGSVVYDLPGGTREEALEALAALPGIPPNVDRGLLAQLLIAREALASTSIGNGIAIPHPRDPVVVPIERPFAFLCFPARPLDFRAADGIPVRVLFLLLSPSVRDHLQMLARLSAALHDGAFRELLRLHASPARILDRLRALERGEPASTGLHRRDA